MEELTERLTCAHVTLDESDSSLKHPKYCETFRRKPQVCSQEIRRREWLDNLKSKREKQLDKNRGIFRKDHGESMEVDKPKRTAREYKNWLMLSEWLIDVPSDLKENWICKICPQGTRALLVADMGRTTAYRRNGYHVTSEFPSRLPGGCRPLHRGTTILDTVFHRDSKTFYVLDVIYWAIQTTDLEAGMRFYWLESKLNETPGLAEFSKTNRYRVLSVKQFPCQELGVEMREYPRWEGNSPSVDGVLFYHRLGSYVQGERSPLVSWLKPFMLPEILGVGVAGGYLAERPSEYKQAEGEEMSVQ